MHYTILVMWVDTVKEYCPGVHSRTVYADTAREAFTHAVGWRAAASAPSVFLYAGTHEIGLRDLWRRGAAEATTTTDVCQLAEVGADLLGSFLYPCDDVVSFPVPPEAYWEHAGQRWVHLFAAAPPAEVVQALARRYGHSYAQALIAAAHALLHDGPVDQCRHCHTATFAHRLSPPAHAEPRRRCWAIVTGIAAAVAAIVRPAIRRARHVLSRSHRPYAQQVSERRLPSH